MIIFYFRSRFTAIAVDWQKFAAEGVFYDVMFVGTGELSNIPLYSNFDKDYFIYFYWVQCTEGSAVAQW